MPLTDEQKKKKREWSRNAYATNPDHRARVTAANLAWRANNRERARENDRRWRLDHPREYKKSVDKYRAANVDKVRAVKARVRLVRYGLTEQEILSMYENREGLCDICSRLLCMCRAKACKRTAVCVDHDHVSGVVRGLLCNSCNMAIGMLGDTVRNVRHAVAYLTAGP